MKTEQEISVCLTGHGKGHVYIDGVEVNGVTYVRVTGEAGGRNQVELRIDAPIVKTAKKPKLKEFSAWGFRTHE